jgi:hypothetical protein
MEKNAKYYSLINVNLGKVLFWNVLVRDTFYIFGSIQPLLNS